jgi:hypothetical protein
MDSCSEGVDLVNKVLVTGLAMGKDHKVGGCCNFDYEWIINDPSVFLWADKVVVPSTIWNSVISSGYPQEHPELAKSLKLLFEMSKSEKVIEVVSTKEIMSPEWSESLALQVEKDRDLLAKAFPEHISVGNADEDKKVPGLLFIDGSEYCGPLVWQIYASLFVAKAVNAQCLFNQHSLRYCRYKFGIDGISTVAPKAKIEAYRTIFNPVLPNESLLHHYAFDHRTQCPSCVNTPKCKEQYLSHVEDRFNTVMKWRNTDEVSEIRHVINGILEKKDTFGDIITSEEVIQEYNQEKRRLQRLVELRFPKVKRWTNIMTTISVPVAIYGGYTGSPATAALGAAVAGGAKMVNEAMDYFTSKHKWINFSSRAKSNK